MAFLRQCLIELRSRRGEANDWGIALPSLHAGGGAAPSGIGASAGVLVQQVDQVAREPGKLRETAGTDLQVSAAPFVQ